jgi:cellulose synthase/poly-beta-1,6-N-acetylglucosamine synthase-like glycosyltransferase
MGLSEDLPFAHEANGWALGQDEITASVIIPMRNEERYIGKCLQSILANDFPRNRYEVLVVDGASTDRSRAIAEEIAPWFGSLRILDNPKAIVPTAMNVAIRASRGRYIIRMDAHAEYPADYISACVEELEKGDADVVGGRLITRPGADTLIARAIALMTQHRFGVGNSAFRINSVAREVDTVPFGAFRKQVFQEVGLFQESLIRHQDFEMNARIRAAGGKIRLDPDIRPTYYNVPTFRKFMRQGYLNGVWMGRSWTRYPVCFCWRHAAPLAFVGSMVVPLVVSLMFPKAALAGAAVMVAYLLGAVISSAHIASRHGARYLLVLPSLFLTYHVVYGLSTIWGFLTFFRIPPAKKTESMTCARGTASENT